MLRNKEQALDDVIHDCVRDEIIEVHTDPTGLDTFAATSDLSFKLMALLKVDSEQTVTVRTSARTAASRLNSEEIIEKCDDKVVVQVFPRWRLDHKGQDGEAIGF